MLHMLLLAGWLASAPAEAASECPAVFDHQVRTLAGDETVSLCEITRGRLALVVNTASFCGFTPQYEGLQALHERYRDRGLMVVGFPSNDFAQEPGAEAQIRDFCELTYGVQFPMFEKVSVRGDDAHPLYRALAGQAGHFPRWNFHKYLVDRDGRVVGSYPSRIAPDDPALIAEIESRL